MCYFGIVLTMVTSHELRVLMWTRLWKDRTYPILCVAWFSCIVHWFGTGSKFLEKWSLCFNLQFWSRFNWFDNIADTPKNTCSSLVGDLKHVSELSMLYMRKEYQSVTEKFPNICCGNWVAPIFFQWCTSGTRFFLTWIDENFGLSVLLFKTPFQCSPTLIYMVIEHSRHYMEFWLAAGLYLIFWPWTELTPMLKFWPFQRSPVG